MEVLVRIDQLSVSIRTPLHVIPILKDVSIEIGKGQFISIVGPSGSGKSTLGTVLSMVWPRGLYQINRGRIIHFRDGIEMDLLTVSPNERLKNLQSMIGYIPQLPESALNPMMTIGKQLKMGLSDEVGASKLMSTLERLHIPFNQIENKFAWQLSGGQQQRVLLAMALYRSPALLIADEPTAALDKKHRESFIELLFQYTNEPHRPGVLLITHDLEMVNTVSDRVYQLTDGTAMPIQPETSQEGQDLRSTPINDLEKPLLSIKGFRGGYKADNRVFEIPSIEILPGQIIGLAGDSGSGKTSILRGIIGILPVSEGEFYWCGERTTPEVLRSKISYIYQDPLNSFNPAMSIGQSLSEIAAFNFGKGLPIADALAAVALDQFYLDRRPHELSGGQIQRLAIARALIQGGKILLCDEPFSSVDASLQVGFLQLVQHLALTRDIAFIIVAHDMTKLSSIAHQVLVLSDRCVAWKGSGIEYSTAFIDNR